MDILRWEKEILPYLPPELRGYLWKALENNGHEILEIRIRLKRPLALETAQGTLFVSRQGFLTEKAEEGMIVAKPILEKIFHLLSQSSAYAFEEELRQGYITVPGGHRVGFVGKAVLDGGKIKHLRCLSGYNFRICRQLDGVAQKIIKFLVFPPQEVHHCLILSGPGMGKTTLLRDIIRHISNGIPSLHFSGVNVGVVDERSELAGSYLGEPQLDLGIRTDILDGCPKHEGMLLLVRSMGPKVIATDELGMEKELEALETIINAGVKVITTVHAANLSELAEKTGWKRLLAGRVFQKVIILNRQGGLFTAEVFDGQKGIKLTNEPVIWGQLFRK